MTHCLTEEASAGIVSVRNEREESEEVTSESCGQCVCEPSAAGIQWRSVAMVTPATAAILEVISIIGFIELYLMMAAQ